LRQITDADTKKSQRFWEDFLMQTPAVLPFFGQALALFKGKRTLLISTDKCRKETGDETINQGK
jgi:hypothetical protein